MRHHTGFLGWLGICLLLVVGFSANCGPQNKPANDGAGTTDASTNKDAPPVVRDTQTVSACAAPGERCGDECVRVKFNNNHCGGCGQKCIGGKTCVDGACECPVGQTACGDICVDVTTDILHCGACGNKCDPGLLCAQGRCVLTCPKPTPATCYGGCVQHENNPQHCGGCGKLCSSDKRCVEGKCSCDKDEATCDGRCVDTNSNIDHCGACGKKCANGSVCSAGKCVTTCGGSSTNCFGSCVDTKTNRFHCGACGKACGSEQLCDGSQCKCLSGRLLCDNRCIDPDTDPLNCGSCNTKCADNQTCGGGKCVDISCPNTDEKPCYGSCIDLQTSRSHCGACGKVCGAQEVCTAGVCVPGQGAACKTNEKPCGGACCKDGELCCSGVCKELKEAEICNGLDDDCDGLIDEDLQAPECDKQKGACAGSRKICAGAKGWLPCDETTYKKLHPAFKTTETKDDCDTVDNDCDGLVDEECPKKPVCKNGESRACYTGPPGTFGNADCKAGTQTCTNGQWDACAGEVLPQQEICNDKDDNCNGQNDDGLTKPCQTTCGSGIATCIAGQWFCSVPKPTAEICDGIDNDCNGMIDDKLTRSCSNLCGVGTESCIGGKWSDCSTKPATEICDGKDNDCDGLTDEGCTCSPGNKRPCGSTRGECTQGSQDCVVLGQQSFWATACTGGVQPSTEICDGKDNDCNGFIDENIHRDCFPSGTQGCTKTATGYNCDGLCKIGSQSCTNGQWGTCTGHIAPVKELCDGLDNDCDGNIDNGCPCKAGDRRPCGIAVGACVQGSQGCDINGQWGPCQGAIGPVAEVCDDKDNDCDGMIDENLTRACYNGPTITAGKGLCKSGVQTCHFGTYGFCLGEVTPRQDDICGNQADDNCNGLIDEACGWFQQIKGQDSQQFVYRVEGDGKDSAYVGGRFYRWAIFAGKTYAYNDNRRRTHSPYVVKINDKGVYQWGFVPVGGQAFFGGFDQWGGGKFAVAGWASRSDDFRYCSYVACSTDFGNGKSMPIVWGRHDAWLAELNETNGLAQKIYPIIGTAGHRYGRSGVIDSKGNVYFGGDFTGNITFTTAAGTTTLTSTQSQHDLFIAKWDSTGAGQWVVKNTSNGRSTFCTPTIGHRSTSLTKMIVDSADNVYLMGPFQGENRYDSIVLKPLDACAQNIFIAKIDGTGKFLWATSVQSDKDAFPKKIYFDAAGKLEITGTFAGKAVMGTTTLNSKGGHDFFISKIDPATGQFISTRHIGATADLRLTDLAYASNGDLVIGGRVAGVLDFGNPNFVSPSTNTNDAFAARFSPTLQLKWALRFKATGAEESVGIALSSNGILMMAGYFDKAFYFNNVYSTTSSAIDGFILGYKID